MRIHRLDLVDLRRGRNRGDFIDETWLKTNMANTTERSHKGARLIDHAPFGHRNTPTLQSGEVIILDNLSSHKRPKAAEAVRAVGAWFLFRCWGKTPHRWTRL